MADKFDQIDTLANSGRLDDRKKALEMLSTSEPTDRGREILTRLAEDSNNTVKFLAKKFLNEKYKEPHTQPQSQAQPQVHSSPQSQANIQAQQQPKPQPPQTKPRPSGQAASQQPAPNARNISAAAQNGDEETEEAGQNSSTAPGQAAKNSSATSFKEIMDLPFLKTTGGIVAAVFAVCFLFSPVLPGWVLFLLYFAVVIFFALNYNNQIAVPLIGGFCFLILMIYAFGIATEFKPTALLIITYFLVGLVVSTFVTPMRSKVELLEGKVQDLTGQIVIQNKIIAKKRDSKKDINQEIDIVTQLKQELKDRSMKFSTMLIKIRELSSTLTTKKILDLTLDILLKELKVKEASIWLFEKSTNEIYPVVWSDNNPAAEMYKQDVRINVKEPRIITRVVTEEGILTLKEANTLRDYNRLIFDRKAKSEAAVCLKVKNDVVGVVNIESLGGRDFTEEDKLLLRTVTHISAGALGNADTFELTREDLVNVAKMKEEELKRQINEKKKLKNVFSKYVSNALMSEVMKNPEALTLGGNRKEITVFFADIRGFTSLSEVREPEEVIEIINRFLSVMTDIILDMGGTLDKYMGDCVMALFGTPLKKTDDEYRAILAAYKIRTATAEIEKELIKQRLPVVNVGIGLNTGVAVVGNIGSEKRMDYTAIGDTVNTTQRIEAHAQKGQILISRSTYDKVKDKIIVKPLEPIYLKGKSKPQEIFEVIDLKEPLPV